MTDRIQGGVERLIAAIEAAIEAKKPPLDDWHDAAFGLLSSLEEAVRHADEGRSADAAMYVRFAIGNLAGIWLSVDEGDVVFLGEEQP